MASAGYETTPQSRNEDERETKPGPGDKQKANEFKGTDLPKAVEAGRPGGTSGVPELSSCGLVWETISW